MSRNADGMPAIGAPAAARSWRADQWSHRIACYQHARTRVACQSQFARAGTRPLLPCAFAVIHHSCPLGYPRHAGFYIDMQLTTCCA